MKEQFKDLIQKIKGNKIYQIILIIVFLFALHSINTKLYSKTEYIYVNQQVDEKIEETETDLEPKKEETTITTKPKEKEETTKKVRPKREVKLTYSVLDVAKSCSNEEKLSSCTRKMEINGKVMDVTFVANKDYFEDFDGVRSFFSKILINGKEVYETTNRIIVLESYGDLLLISMKCYMCGGYIMESPFGDLIDLTGEKLNIFSEAEFDKGFEYSGYSIKNNKLFLFANSSAFGNYEDFGPDPVLTSCYYIPDKVRIYDENYNIYSGMPVKLKYEATYSGYDKIDKLKLLEVKKFGDLYSRELCNREYEYYQEFDRLSALNDEDLLLEHYNNYMDKYHKKGEYADY